MYQVFVNEEPGPAENGWKSWGELLRAVEGRCTAAGQVVTAVRFDGVDQPAFREAALESRELADIATVEIEATRPTDLLLSSLDQAVSAADALAQSAERMAAGFRGFDVSAANAELREFAGSLATLISFTTAICQATGVDLAGVDYEGAPAAQMVDELLAHADAMIGAQQVGDWITLADIVEYDLAPALGRWPGLFDALRARVPGATALDPAP